MRTIVGNLRRQHEKVHVAEDQIADAVERVITSHAVSSSIASLALKVADERAMENDGNTFLEPKAQQLALAQMGKGAPAQPNLAAAATAALRGGRRGVMGVVQQALAAEEGAAGGGEEALEYDKEGRKPVPRSYAESGFPDTPSTSKSWQDAMSAWQQEGIAAKPDERFPALANGAALTNTHQLGLSALALQTLAHNPASGVTGPAAGTFGGLWDQHAADKYLQHQAVAIKYGYNPGAHSAYYGAAGAPGASKAYSDGPYSTYLRARNSVQQELAERGRRSQLPVSQLGKDFFVGGVHTPPRARALRGVYIAPVSELVKIFFGFFFGWGVVFALLLLGSTCSTGEEEVGEEGRGKGGEGW